jgi:hypothetical protein
MLTVEEKVRRPGSVVYEPEPEPELERAAAR